MGNRVQEVLKRSQKSWVLLGQTTAWVVGVLAGFLLPPPIGTAEDSRVWVRFAQFVITIVIGLVLLAALRWKSPKHVLRWGAISVSFLMLGSVAFFAYQVLVTRWTVIYAQQRVVVGDHYTKYGREYLDQHPTLAREDLMMHFSGKVERIWEPDALSQRRLFLAATYVVAMPLFTVSIMSILQAIHCAAGRTASRRASVSPAKRVPA
jgi:hypothetical protein